MGAILYSMKVYLRKTYFDKGLIEIKKGKSK